MKQPEESQLLKNKYYSEPSIFYLKISYVKARRQKNISNCEVPEICVLDPDDDLVSYLLKTNGAIQNECWACYHSKMYNVEIEGTLIGIIPYIVGASFAVLVAEQLFVSGCKYLISITSAGIIQTASLEKRFALITESIRDEGTSYHYMPVDAIAKLSNVLFKKLLPETDQSLCPYFEAKSWTTDAPYRETSTAIASMQKQNICCVEMEASALYAFVEVKEKKVICFAHLTNSMAQLEGDFEKGEDFGSRDTLNLLSYLLKRIF
jgi:uridine phosphorylase